MTTPLISAAELAGRLAEGPPAVVLDVRWALGGADRAAYLADHVPTAQFVDLDIDLAAPVGNGRQGRHPLPEPVELERTWRRLGIRSDSDVVVYDARDASSAGRAWWLLRWSGHQQVRVLDGGYASWRAAGLASESGAAPAPEPGNVVVRAGSLPTVDADRAGELASHGALLDARSAQRYRGEIEPIDPIAGHIPGAVNLPLDALVHSDGRFRPIAELLDLFREAGIGPGAAAAASCGSGVSACQLVLGGAVAGIDLALYPGSWSQWCALGRPVEVGPTR